MAHHHRDLAMSAQPTAAELYAARVIATTPLRFNKLNEASGSAIVDSSGNGYTGTYTGVDLANADSPFLPDKSPFFDGTNDYGSLHSNAFATAFNMDEFTIMIWSKVNASSVWTDGVDRYWFRLLRDANNRVAMQKSGSNGIFFECRVGSSNFNILAGSQSDTGWTCYAFSGSVAGGGLLSAGDVRAYKNGVQIGSTATGRIASTGSGLNATFTTLGSANVTPQQAFHGYLSHMIVWNRPMASDILALMAA